MIKLILLFMLSWYLIEIPTPTSKVTYMTMPDKYYYLLGLHERRDKVQLSNLLTIDPSTTAWCADFVNALEHMEGRRGTNRLNARSFLTYGTESVVPTKGDIVVLWRSGKKSAYGHVGYLVSIDKNYVTLFGGNQGDSVSLKKYPISRILSIRSTKDL